MRRAGLMCGVWSNRYVDTEIRQNSYGPKDFNPASGGMMSPKRCAELIVEAADQVRALPPLFREAARVGAVCIVLEAAGKAHMWARTHDRDGGRWCSR
jgi:hypothetical protein